MTVRLAVLALVLAGAGGVLPAAPAAAAPASTCPSSFEPVTAKDVKAELRRNGITDKAVLADVDDVVFARDANGDGVLCQQVGSFGRAQGLPEFFSNFKDNTTVR